ncbi:MAG: pseudouridine-5'-phosphate glycosidase [Pseudonocardiaceae bacterium]
MAHSLEEAARAAGATPATVGVIGGRVRVGSEPDEIERLGGAGEILKCAAGDLGWAIARGADGATTVSADLPTLAHHPVAVVAAGAKSILDLPRTLEALERLGVPVVGLGTRDFPAFYARSSGLLLDKHAERPEDIARFCLIRWRRLSTATAPAAHRCSTRHRLDKKNTVCVATTTVCVIVGTQTVINPC